MDSMDSVDISDKSTRADSALLRAVIKGNIRKAKKLLKGGFFHSLFGSVANVNAVVKHHPSPHTYTVTTPLAQAVYAQNLEMVKLLLEAGASVDLSTGSGSLEGLTLLIRASGSGSIEMVELLLEAGADVDAFAENHMSPLAGASKGGRLAVIKVLVRKGATVTTENSQALCWASFSGHADIVEFLLANGANVNSRMFQGEAYKETALEIAKSQGHREIEQILISHGATG